MSNVVLTLGGVAFQDMEVPERICFGGRQRVAVQNLIGGGRVVSTLGLDDGEISFSGIFSGDDAVSRVQELDAARGLGAQLPLIWDGFYYIVVIAEFTAEYRKSSLISFSIRCFVVNDPLASLVNQFAPIGSLIEADVAAALALSGQAGLSLQGISATSLVGLSAVQGAVTAGLGSMGVSLSSLSSSLTGTTTPNLGIGVVTDLGAVTGQLAGASALQGFVNRAAKNLGTSLL